MIIVENTKPRIINEQGVAFMPGLNTLTGDKIALWEKAKENRCVQQDIEAGYLVEKAVPKAESKASMKADDAVETDAESVADMKADDAINIIKDTLDVATLEGWEADEHNGKHRSTVLKALDDQLTELGRKAD